VRPKSVTGASKRWGELIMRHFTDMAESQGTGQRCSSVRFGDVLDSSGSVVPLFREQIAAAGPVTVTDKRMWHYFMTITGAAELIAQSTALAEGRRYLRPRYGRPNIDSDAGREHDRPGWLERALARKPAR
jgi:FlaA1/EpsC-like NDP-sugar epimerase